MHATVLEEKVGRISGYLLRLVYMGMVFMALKSADTIIQVMFPSLWELLFS